MERELRTAEELTRERLAEGKGELLVDSSRLAPKEGNRLTRSGLETTLRHRTRLACSSYTKRVRETHDF